jgi:2-polyprenyl-3-methyl-5-hydroxy-6-metoxy-1,4-benzoquinol methylase
MQICSICKSRAPIDDIGAVAPTHPGPFHVDRFTLKHCGRCDVVFLDPLPTAADLRTLYQDSTQFTSEHYTGEERTKAVLEYLATSIVNRGLVTRPDARCLEVGAGLAWMSRACKAHSPTITTVAQDVSSEAAAICPWVDRYHVAEVNTLIAEEPFDLISLTHVVEHLIDPQAILAHLATRLAPGGKIFITAPFRPEAETDWQDIEAWKSYSYLHVPAHVAYLSQTWFQNLAALAHLRLAVWDPSHENGQAFEVVLVKP